MAMPTSQRQACYTQRCAGGHKPGVLYCPSCGVPCRGTGATWATLVARTCACQRAFYLPQEAVFCPKCGRRITETPPVEKTPDSDHTGRVAFGTALAVVAAFIAVIAIAVAAQTRDKTAATPEPGAATTYVAQEPP